MFERFTEHARHALQFENREAQRMHHTYLGTEHLLLALLREPDGHGHRALESLGVDISVVRQVINQLVEQGPEVYQPDGLHNTPRMQHVIQLALEEARKLKHSHIGTEHLLLGLLAEPEGVAVRTLEAMNVAPDAVRAEVLWILEREGALHGDEPAEEASA